MIPVVGFEGAKVAVLGLGRSGLATAHALRAGGAKPVCWDDNPAAREKAESEGFECDDLHRPGNLEPCAALIVSPGIPHLYPTPNPVIRSALELGVPVDKDIGLFFRSLANAGMEQFRCPAPCRGGHRIERQIHHGCTADPCAG